MINKDVKKILYEDKQALESLSDVKSIHKFSDEDANEIKNVVNSNAVILEELANQNTIDVSSKLDVNIFEQYKNENDLKVNNNIEGIRELNNKIDTKLNTDIFENEKSKIENKIESNIENINDLTTKVNNNADYIDNTLKTTYLPNKWNEAVTQTQSNLTAINEQVKKVNDLTVTKMDVNLYKQEKQILEQNIESNKQLSNNNKLAIDSNSLSIERLSQNVTKIIDGFVIEDSKVYDKNSMGYKLIDGKENWFISIVNNAKGNKTDDTNQWKVIEAPVNIPSYDNYYNKQEMNNLLSPLEQRLQNNENNVSNNRIKIDQNSKEIDNFNVKYALKNQVKDLYDWIIAQGYLTNTDLTQIENRLKVIELMVPDWNAKVDSDALEHYYTTQEVNDTFAKIDYVNTTFKKNLKDNTNFIVLPKNSKVGVNEWNDYKAMFAGAVDINNNQVNFDSYDYVSDNYGAYNGYTRSYINYVDFYLPSSNSNLNYFEKEFNDKNVIIFPTSNNFELSNLPNGRRLLKFQMYIPNDINANDWWPNVPQEVKEITNINFVEFFDFVVFDGNMTCRPSDISVMVGQYSHRIFIKAGQGTSTYWQGKFIRFTTVIN